MYFQSTLPRRRREVRQKWCYCLFTHNHMRLQNAFDWSKLRGTSETEICGIPAQQTLLKSDIHEVAYFSTASHGCVSNIHARGCRDLYC